MPKKEVKKELLLWCKKTFPTVYQQKYTKIDKFIENLDSNIKFRNAKLFLQEFLIKNIK